MIWEVIKTILCFGLNILMKKWKEVIQEEVKTALEPKLEELNLESSYKTFQLLTQEKEIDFFLIIKYELIESYYQDALKYIK
ncbi:MAG: hypothetical protein E7Y34_00980, partial [Mycoplasma sp.]|nr:hypothetical protein [Mycoplasma sp.]